MSNTANASYAYFLKGDISGIQDFIFNVKSEGAAKSLKGRSFFIHLMSLIGIEMIEHKLGKQNTYVFYNGGGNFFLFLKEIDVAKILELQYEIDQFCIDQNYHLVLSYIPIHNKNLDTDFGNLWQELNERSNQDKLKKFSRSLNAFEKYSAPENQDWSGFTQFLKKIAQDKTYAINPTVEEEISINEEGATIFGYQLTQGEKDLTNIVLELPRWTRNLIDQNRILLELERQEKSKSDPDYVFPRPGMIIEFSYLAAFAKERTGTNKIGILKMDVDNLGLLFSILNLETAYTVSQQITQFFGGQIESMLNEEMKKSSESSETSTVYGNNIYTIFSGGDDCFFVGAWDAIIDWAKYIHKEFTAVATPLMALVIEKTDLPKEDIPEITISGSIAMLEPTHPVVRFADLAQDTLDDAKLFIYNGEHLPQKNKINVLGEILEWEDFNDTIRIATLLEKLVIEKEESRSTLEKIRYTAIEFSHLRKNVLKGNYSGPNVSLLYYALRNSKNGEELTKEVVTPFAQELIAAFSNGANINPLKYPLAARIAEFSTRKQ